MVFDGHVYPIDLPEGMQLASPAAVVEMLEQAGIDQAMLVARDGDELVRHVDANDRCYAMLWVNPTDPAELDRARAFLGHDRFRGLKIHGGEHAVAPDDPRTLALLELAGERGLPVAFHCGHPPPSHHTQPWMIERAVKAAPDVRIVLVSMGLCVFEYHDAAMEIAERHPNVYLDVSAMPHSWRVKEAVERIGADRVLYGSSAPYFHPKLELMKIHTANLSPEQAEAVLGGSAMALYLGRS